MDECGGENRYGRQSNNNRTKEIQGQAGHDLIDVRDHHLWQKEATVGFASSRTLITIGPEGHQIIYPCKVKRRARFFLLLLSSIWMDSNVLLR